MAMIAPAHRISTIHGSFGGPSFSSLIPTALSASSADQAAASSFASLPNITLTASRAAARTANLSVLSPRSSASGSSSSSSPLSPPPEFKTRPRSRSITAPCAPVLRRAPPSPPASRTIEVIGSSQDPFADSCASDNSVSNYSGPPVIISLSPPRRYSRGAYMGWKPFDPEEQPSESNSSAWSAPVYRPTVVSAPPCDRKAARLVACVLLSRACGRPMRRRPACCGEERPYVKSCLSRIVALD